MFAFIIGKFDYFSKVGDKNNNYLNISTKNAINWLFIN